MNSKLKYQALATLLCVIITAEVRAQLPNAWQISDNSTSGGSTLNYTTNLSAAQHMAATNLTSGWRYSIHARFVADFGEAKTMNMSYGFGSKRFLIWFDLAGNGDLTAELEGGITYTLTTNGTGAALYHTHEIIYNPTNGTASYLVDGQVKTNNWPGSNLTSPAGRVSWGAGSFAEQGEMNFHTARFEIPGLGVVAEYDAGTAGNPPVAPDPTTQGWTMNPSEPAPGTIGRPVAADTIGQLPNAWQITDDSTAGGSTFSYTNQLNATLRAAATNDGFRFSVNARFVTNFAGTTKTMTMLYGLGNRRYLIWWDLDGNTNLTAELDGGPTYTLTTNGTGSALYHTHEFIYDPATGRASYVFDGQVIATNWQSSANASPAGRIAWGTGSSPGQGQMNFHSVTFEITNAVVASYDAGMVGEPAVAPDPVTQGWFRSPSAPGDVGIGDISPDMALLPAATTVAADQFTPSSARLNGQANPKGSPAMAWFEWGTSLAYGNSTAPQLVGAGTSAAGFSNVISGLVIGTEYHFRAVVSNAFGMASGFDQDFNLNTKLPTATTLAVDQLTNTSARLNGQVNPSGSPTMAWFEWGTDANYGNATATQDVGAGSSVSNLNAVLNALGAGLDYHYRLMASNAFGAVAGADRSFNLSFLLTSIPGLPQVERSSVAWGDYDQDGRLDFLLTGTSNGSFTGAISQLWRNTGSGFSNVTASVVLGLPGVYYSSLAWGDYDNDGRLDFLLTGTANGSTGVSQLWRNTGSGFSNVTASVAPGLPGVAVGSVAWGDYDQDGRLDFLLTGTTNGSSSGAISQLWRNTGSGFSNVTASVAPGLPGVYNSSVEWGDYDQDGRLDFLLTGDDGSIGVSQLWRNNLPGSNAPPAAPVGLSATVSGSTVTLSWNAPADDFTPAAGLNYNVRIGSVPGASDVLSALALTNGLRLLPALGNAQSGTNGLFQAQPGRTYYWSVQAVDTAFAGGAFATEASFTVPPPTLSIVSVGTNAIIFWQPSYPGWILQESLSLAPIAWTNSSSGSTNPVVAPVTPPTKFYRLFKP